MRATTLQAIVYTPILIVIIYIVFFHNFEEKDKNNNDILEEKQVEQIENDKTMETITWSLSWLK